MSIADHFEHTPDAGLIRTYDSGAARRQFSVSVILIVVIVTAAAALGVLVRFDGGSRAPVAISGDTPAYAGHL